MTTLHPLSSLHTFALDASCPDIQTIDSVDSLVNAISRLSNSPYLLLGEGSNTIFTEDYHGVIIKNCIKGINVYEDDENYFLTVASGENWHDLVCYCMQKRIYGFENLALIPGTVGASPIQNIGAYGVEIEKYIHSVEFLDVSTMMMGYFNQKECAFGYRESRFKQEPGKRIITSVNFVLPKRNHVISHYGPLADLNEPTPEDIFEKVIATRMSKLPDPNVLGNAGSFFKNPTIAMSDFLSLQRRYKDMPHYSAPDAKVKIPAAWLIDQLGFKGKREGAIGCHEHQALVLVNHGGGTGEDLLTLARKIKREVLHVFNIELENEVRLFDKNGPIRL